jgi:hypothetical protein
MALVMPSNGIWPVLQNRALDASVLAKVAQETNHVPLMPHCWRVPRGLGRRAQMGGIANTVACWKITSTHNRYHVGLVRTPATSGVARPQATRAFAWGVEEKSFVHCSDFTLFNTV